MFGGMYFRTTSALLANCETARVTSAPSCKIHLFDADALVAGRLNTCDVIDHGRHLALMQRQNPILDIRRAHAGVRPHHADDRDIHLRENIHRHSQRLGDSEQRNENEKGDDRIGAPENVLNE